MRDVVSDRKVVTKCRLWSSNSPDGVEVGPVGLGMDLLAMVDGEWHVPVCHSIQRGTSQVR
jgi:hypothetical protein